MRLTLNKIAKERSLRYWSKLIRNQHLHTFRIFNEQINSPNTSAWGNRIKEALDKLGFGNMWNDYATFPLHNFIFKQRIHNQYIQTWSTQLNNTPKLDYYRHFKNKLFENFLSDIQNDKLRRQLIWFRVTSHTLEIKFGRFMGSTRQDRICKVCNNNAVESEYHFLLCCPVYSNIRQTHLGKRFIRWPSIQKYNKTMASENKTLILHTEKTHK